MFHCEVRTESLSIIHVNLIFTGGKNWIENIRRMTVEIIPKQIKYCKQIKDENKEGSGKDGRSCEVGRSFFTWVKQGR